jgi:hypothetical protein
MSGAGSPGVAEMLRRIRQTYVAEQQGWHREEEGQWSVQVTHHD